MKDKTHLFTIFFSEFFDKTIVIDRWNRKYDATPLTKGTIAIHIWNHEDLVRYHIMVTDKFILLLNLYAPLLSIKFLHTSPNANIAEITNAIINIIKENSTKQNTYPLSYKVFCSKY